MMGIVEYLKNNLNEFIKTYQENGDVYETFLEVLPNWYELETEEDIKFVAKRFKLPENWKEEIDSEEVRKSLSYYPPKWEGKEWNMPMQYDPYIWYLEELINQNLKTSF
jgi:hypothetical protein